MTQNLVPDNLPYGERKALVQQREAAGIPVDSSGGAGNDEPTTGSTPPQRASGAAPVDISGYDVFANRQPTQPQFPQESTPPVTTGGVLAQTAQTAANPFIREFATRLTQLRKG